VGTDGRSKVPTDDVFGQGHPSLIIDHAFTTKVLLTIHQSALDNAKIHEDEYGERGRGDAGQMKLGICNTATLRGTLLHVRHCLNTYFIFI
jgi:hypothetical protein